MTSRRWSYRNFVKTVRRINPRLQSTRTEFKKQYSRRIEYFIPGVTSEPFSNLILYWFTSNRLVCHFVPRRYLHNGAIPEQDMSSKVYCPNAWTPAPYNLTHVTETSVLSCKHEVLDFILVLYVAGWGCQGELTDKWRNFLTGWKGDYICIIEILADKIKIVLCKKAEERRRILFYHSFLNSSFVIFFREFV